MYALTFQGKEKISYQQVSDPEIKNERDAIVKVKMTAICGSDLHIYHEREKGLDCGTVMGHEFVGEVVETGKSVRHLMGQQVFSPFTINCGECFFCQKGLTARCIHSSLYGWVEKGCGLHGAQAEYVRVPFADTTLVNVPDGVSAEESILLADILCTGYFCADMAQVRPGGVYVVIGCGPVGIMSIIGAKELGAEIIYALDNVEERLQLAQQFGAIPIHYQKQNSKEIIMDATKGVGADAVLEVVGSGAAERTAFELVQPGGIISVVGVHTDNHFSFSPVEAYNKNITYKIGRCSARHYASKLIPIVQQKKYNLTSIISHKLPLAQGAEAYTLFSQKKDNCTKLILETTFK